MFRHVLYLRCSYVRDAEAGFNYINKTERTFVRKENKWLNIRIYMRFPFCFFFFSSSFSTRNRVTTVLIYATLRYSSFYRLLVLIYVDDISSGFPLGYVSN